MLEDSARGDFAAMSLEALRSTLEQDRHIAFDEQLGLYRGEQSFLDWREQSYPGFVAEDPAQIAISYSLSTNLGHLAALELAAELSAQSGNSSDSSSYTQQAQQLRASIENHFWDEQLGFVGLLPSQLDPVPNRRLDLLGSAQAILSGVGTAQQRQQNFNSSF